MKKYIPTIVVNTFLFFVYGGGCALAELSANPFYWHAYTRLALFFVFITTVAFQISNKK